MPATASIPLEMMTRQMATEQRTVWTYPRPLTFDEWLAVGAGSDELTELIDGALVEKSMVRLDHEKLGGWLYHLLALYAQRRDLGIVLASRIPVKISDHRGRMPDLFFVRKENQAHVGQKSTTVAPDLVIEIVSPGDRPSDVSALETDYQSIGVGEVVFIDQRRARVRVQRRGDAGYSEVELAGGDTLTFSGLDDLALEVDWLLNESARPDALTLLLRLVAGAE
jgi:Uma2 family endonuclease